MGARVEFFIVASIYLLLGGVVFVANTEETTFRKSDNFFQNVKYLVPEKWNFFTKNPRAEKVYFYETDLNGDYIPSPKFPGSSIGNLLGFKRNARAGGAEIGFFTENYISNENWTSFEGGSSILQAAKSDTVATFRIVNEFLKPQLCGEYLITFQSPVPWAWRVSEEQVNMPGTFIKIIFNCDE